MKIIMKDTLNHQNYKEDHSDQLKQLHKKFATYACGSGYSNVASMASIVMRGFLLVSHLIKLKGKKTTHSILLFIDTH